MTNSHQAVFETREDLKIYKDNARTLFALETRFRLEDIHTVAENSLTDGNNDKNCDLVYVDRDAGIAVIAQGYEPQDASKPEAKANKAASLNTAVGWLLTRKISDLPERLQSAATDLRSALNDNDIRVLELWYVHNRAESKNVLEELKTAEKTASAALKQYFPDIEIETCSALEVGKSVLEEWYQALEAPILVSDEFNVIVPGAFEVHGDNWQAVVTTVPAIWLHELWTQHQSKLFSANVRDYLGSRRSDRNVNHNIKKTAQEKPNRFWAYNNGITAIINDYTLTKALNYELKINGISIVNGAQTTGSLGSLATRPDPKAMVQARFVKCTDVSTIQELIQFNNTQNSVKATDFRSNDSVQRRLREEFHLIPNAEYTGGRRGGSEDLIRRTPSLLPTDSCSQALAALHGEPGLAYNRKSEIWESDKLYAKFFSDATNAQHIVFAFSLLRAVEKKKRALVQLGEANLSTTQKTQLSFLRNRGATFLLVAAIGRCLETVMGKPIANVFRFSFGKASPQSAIGYWDPIVEATIPFSSRLQGALESGLKKQEAVAKDIATFQEMVEATRSANSSLYEEFVKNVVEL